MNLVVGSFQFCKIVLLYEPINIFFWFVFWHAWFCDIEKYLIIESRLLKKLTFA